MGIIADHDIAGLIDKHNLSVFSETSKVRHIVAPLIARTDYVVDIGFGGDKIVPWALGADMPTPYTNVGTDAVDIPCYIQNGLPIRFRARFDVVYSSHLIEDFEDTRAILRHMIAALRPGGLLVVVIPDEPTYRKHCATTGQSYNQSHKLANMGMEHMQACVNEVCENRLVLMSDCEIDYNVVLAVRVS